MDSLSHKQDAIVRAQTVGSSGTDPLEEQANYLVNYYQSLCDRQNDEPWLLGLYMAKQWLRYLNEPEHDLEELKLFVRALESQRQSQGSGWSDLWIRVRNWVARIEQREPS